MPGSYDEPPSLRNLLSHRCRRNPVLAPRGVAGVHHETTASVDGDADAAPSTSPQMLRRLHGVEGLAVGERDGFSDRESGLGAAAETPVQRPSFADPDGCTFTLVEVESGFDVSFDTSPLSLGMFQRLGHGDIDGTPGFRFDDGSGTVDADTYTSVHTTIRRRRTQEAEVEACRRLDPRDPGHGYPSVTDVL